MRRLSEAEVLSLREILQSEVMGIQKAKVMETAAKDEHVKQLVSSGITAAEGRIRGIQQFISENEILDAKEVH